MSGTGEAARELLALVLCLVEVVRDLLELQAVRRFQARSLTPEEEERLGRALEELDRAMERLKEEHGIGEEVARWRRDLDRQVEDILLAFEG